MNSNVWDLAQKKYQPEESQVKKSPFDAAESTFSKGFPLEGENDLDREIERNIARQTARGVETVAGLPGDVQSLVSGLTGHEFETKFPTREELQKKTEAFGQGYLSPKGEFEEKTDEIVGDITAMSLPGGGASKATHMFARSIGIPIAANLAKEGLTKYGDVGKDGASLAKVGTMFALDLLSNRQGMGMGGVRKYASHLFGEAEKALPAGAMLDVKNLKPALSNLKNSLNMGGEATSKTKALQKIAEIEGKIKDGKIQAKELMEFRKTINEAIEEMGGFEWFTKPKLRKRAIDNLNAVKKEVIGGLNEYGATQNPQFLKFNKDANEAYAAIENSNQVKKFFTRHLGNIGSYVGTKLLFGGVPELLSIGGPGTAIAGGAAALTNEAIKIFHRVKNSPVLAKYYKNIVDASINGNAPQAISNYKKLDKGLQQSEGQ